MERKRRSGSVPALGRIALKRVAMPIESQAPAPGETTGSPATVNSPAAHADTDPPVEGARSANEAPASLRRALVIESDGPVREAVAACLPDEVFATETFERGEFALEAFGRGGAALAIIGRELGEASGVALCRLIRRAAGGAAVGIVLMSPAYRDPVLGARESNAYGADAFLPLPAGPELLAERVELALSRREPIERLRVLPPDIARAIDARFESHERLDYYALLEVDRRADEPEIRDAYYRIARWLHPDRHARLRTSHPHAYERINTLYKRLGEAYAVLVDDDRRRSYNLGLHKRGSLRLEAGRQGDREARELAMCSTDDARSHVLESLEARSLGDLEWAEEAMRRAVESEPENRPLALILDSIGKLLDIVRRSRA